MRFIVDHMLPRDLAELLLSLGHEAFTAKRLNISADDAIWQHAEKLEAVVISKDSDYLPLANQLAKAQFVHLQVGNMTTADLLELIRSRMPTILHALQSGEKIVDVK